MRNRTRPEAELSCNSRTISALINLSLWSARPSVVRTSLFRSAGARCGLERRENASRSETMRPTRAVSVEIRPRYLRNSASRPGGIFAFRHQALEQHGKIQHARDGIIDLVRHAGGELAQ